MNSLPTAIQGLQEEEWLASTGINQHLLWDLMSVDFGNLTRRSVHPASPVLLVKNFADCFIRVYLLV